ncbi:MAG TPA: S9 family peptidase [Terriglobales bacterium]|nr:S9 family peptidase [Terriglobales bacterium]
MSRAISPPTAPRRPTFTSLHGDVRVDDYAWLRNKTEAEVIAHLEAENAFTRARTRGTDQLQRTLFQEMRRRLKETDLDVPIPLDDWYYYSRTERGRQYPIFCRKHGKLTSPEEVILDHNALAVGLKYCAVESHAISPNHRLLAYTIDLTGDERLTLRVKNLDSGELLSDTIVNVGTIAWASDSETIFYVVLDEAHRPHKVYRHRLGQPVAEDELVHHEKDEAFYASVVTTRSRRFVLIHSRAKTSSEVRYLPADRPDGRFRILQARQPKLEYSVDHHGDYFFIVNNHRARNFKLDKVRIGRTGLKHWQPVIPHRRNILVEDLAAFADHLVLFEREDGLEHIRIVDLAGREEHRIAFDEPTYSASPGPNLQFQTSTVRFIYTSLVTPQSVFDYDMRTRALHLMKRTEVRGGYDPKNYRSERIYATASDGKKVPISIVYRAGSRRDGRAPMLLTGYGAYGLSRDPSFSIARVSLLDRGLIYAIAHIRGGSELGRAWYEDGKLLKKKNTFTDFIAAAETLVRRRYTRRSKLAINGGSAGGLLMGAVANMRPDLFALIVADVPFVDCLNTMLDPSLPLTVTEYDEWGNPNEPKYYRYIKSYSPYENVTAQRYPTMLVTAGLNDPRVGYWEPAKWVAKLRQLKTDNHELVLKTEMRSGHFGASGRYDLLKEVAFEYAYILTRLGVVKTG